MVGEGNMELANLWDTIVYATGLLTWLYFCWKAFVRIMRYLWVKHQVDRREWSKLLKEFWQNKPKEAKESHSDKIDAK